MATVDARPLVRPRFLAWSIVVFVLLVPFVAHAAWDYLESRQLAQNIARIREDHEPVSVQDIEPYRHLRGEAADAERFYRAGAALARAIGDDDRRGLLLRRFTDALAADAWPPTLVADMRRVVAEREDALGFFDRATRLPFEGF